MVVIVPHGQGCSLSCPLGFIKVFVLSSSWFFFMVKVQPLSSPLVFLKVCVLSLFFFMVYPLSCLLDQGVSLELPFGIPKGLVLVFLMSGIDFLKFVSYCH